MDLKRYYIDIDQSVAYGHLSIPTPLKVELTLPFSTTRTVKSPCDNRGLVFETNKRHKSTIEAALKRPQV